MKKIVVSLALALAMFGFATLDHGVDSASHSTVVAGKVGGIFGGGGSAGK